MRTAESLLGDSESLPDSECCGHIVTVTATLSPSQSRSVPPASLTVASLGSTTTGVGRLTWARPWASKLLLLRAAQACLNRRGRHPTLIGSPGQYDLEPQPVEMQNQTYFIWI